MVFFLNRVSFLAVIGALFAMRLLKRESKKESGSPFRVSCRDFALR
jgi:hypothetical protein